MAGEGAAGRGAARMLEAAREGMEGAPDAAGVRIPEAAGEGMARVMVVSAE